MRYHYYFHSLRMEKKAMQYYNELNGAQAGSCRDCEGYCEKACPHGVRSRFLLSNIHEELSFDKGA
jgi:predicted aldo/keto reductase-like oxidoreductase